MEGVSRKNEKCDLKTIKWYCDAEEQQLLVDQI